MRDNMPLAAQSSREITIAALQKFNSTRLRKTTAFMLRHRQAFRCMVTSRLEGKGGSTMSAVAEVMSTVARNSDPRGSDLPTCPVCADSMVAAEASAYLTDNVISYLWTCDTCGYGFVTKHTLKRFACN
jgi:hypothetical protein